MEQQKMDFDDLNVPRIGHRFVAPEARIDAHPPAHVMNKVVDGVKDMTIQIPQGCTLDVDKLGVGTVVEIPPLLRGVPQVEGPENELPPIDEYIIKHDLFLPPPNCQQQHIYTAMKVAGFFSDLGVQLFYGCPHNIHLRRALRELKLAHEASNKAILSDIS